MKKAAERRKERRAEEPRECNHRENSNAKANRKPKSTGAAERRHPSAGRGCPVAAGQSRPAASKSSVWRNEAKMMHNEDHVVAVSMETMMR